jgi:hypothetical protein
MGKTNFFYSTMPFNPWGNFSHIAACMSSLKNTGKMNLHLKINSPWAHTELELDVLGVPKSL